MLIIFVSEDKRSVYDRYGKEGLQGNIYFIHIFLQYNRKSGTWSKRLFLIQIYCDLLVNVYTPASCSQYHLRHTLLMFRRDHLSLSVRFWLRESC